MKPLALAPQPRIIRKVIPTFASNPGPKKSGVLYRNLMCMQLENLGSLIGT